MSQHLHCYGYRGSKDPRLPQEHICYWCLLSDADVDNFMALQELAVKLGTMFHVRKSGIKTKTELSKTLGK